MKKDTKAKPTTHSINKCAINHLFTQKHDTRPGKLYTQHQSDCGKQKINILFPQFSVHTVLSHSFQFPVSSLFCRHVQHTKNVPISNVLNVDFHLQQNNNNNQFAFWVLMLWMWCICCEQTKCPTLKLHFFLTCMLIGRRETLKMHLLFHAIPNHLEFNLIWQQLCAEQ